MVNYLIYVCILYRQYNCYLMSLQQRYFHESTTVKCTIYISLNYYYILCIKYYFYFLCNVKLFSFLFKLVSVQIHPSYTDVCSRPIRLIQSPQLQILFIDLLVLCVLSYYHIQDIKQYLFKRVRYTITKTVRQVSILNNYEVLLLICSKLI